MGCCVTMGLLFLLQFVGQGAHHLRFQKFLQLVELFYRYGVVRVAGHALLVSGDEFDLKRPPCLCVHAVLYDDESIA